MEYIHSGNDNIIELILKEDGVAVDLSAITRITLTCGATTLDSATTSPTGLGSGNVFDTSEGSGKLILRLGDSGLSDGRYPQSKLILYDTSNTDGIVWGTIRLTVT